ncbi:CotH kinase family protein [Sorangium cellulosum]|uniref:CotH kinase family protein n=1 Tax=Sorangium TaxID=39643 RepID=UPI000A8E8684|nr:CotH kinase family protein [Sorangium cellulosum]
MARKLTSAFVRAGSILSTVALTMVLGAAACSSDPDQAPSGNAGGGGAGGGAIGASSSGSSSGDGGAPGTSTPDPSDAMFDPDHVLDVAIEMAPEDWEKLRRESRDVSEVLGEGCMDGPRESPYTQFPATVTIDGEALEMSAVRKKGFLGSASLSKPSLKVSFDEYVDGREHAGLKGLTLNNARQDPSLIKTCLAFKVFGDAGLPASRCSFARVTVNGKDLGIYAHVEPVGKRLLKRHFPDDGGNLYEGQISDFRDGWSATYEKKTNEDDPDRSDLDAVTAALLASDAELDAELGEVLDIAAFRRYWATETLIAAWDGYAGNVNNHFVYFDPDSGKMSFLPWGPDMSFDATDPLGPAGRPQSVSAKGAIAHRLYQTPELRALYAEAMAELLDEVWKEDELLLEIDRMEELLAPYVSESAEAVKAGTDAVRSFVSGRRAVISAEIAPTPPTWTYAPPAEGCLTPVATMTGTFSTTWGSLAEMDPFATGTGTLTVTLPEGEPQSSDAMGVASGYDTSMGGGPDFATSGRAQLMVVGSFPDGNVRALFFIVDPEVFAAGKDAPYDWQSAVAFALDVTQPEPVLIGLSGGGEIHFDEASMEPGAPVSGSFTVTVLGGGIF